jgi:hypothetical protein
MKRILPLLAAIICLCSCEKEQKHHWLSREWVGEYEAQVQNNDTGEYTTVTVGIVLMFSDDKTQCTVKTGYSDLLSMNSKTYYADVYDDAKTFSLREYPGDVELVYTSEMVSGKRILKWREGTEERSINIEAILLE